MFLIVMDAHSKWMEAFPMNTSTSSATIEKLRIAFATHSLPEIVVTNNGSNFASKEFGDFLKQNGSVTSEQHPTTQRLMDWLREQYKHSRRE